MYRIVAKYAVSFRAGSSAYSTGNTDSRLHCLRRVHTDFFDHDYICPDQLDYHMPWSYSVSSL